MADHTEILKTLHVRLIDSREGYRMAADHVDSLHVQGIFAELVARRDASAAELRSVLDRRDVTLDEDGSILASPHRMFVDLKDRVTASDDAATMAEVVRGEKVLLGTYDDAIAAGGVADSEFRFLADQRASLAGAIDQLETRRDLAA